MKLATLKVSIKAPSDSPDHENEFALAEYDYLKGQIKHDIYQNISRLFADSVLVNYGIDVEEADE